MKFNLKLYLIKILLIVLSFSLAALGISIMYTANLGSSPIATMADGWHHIFYISRGTGNLLSNALCLIPVFFFAKDLIRTGTLVCLVTLGPQINMWNDLLPGLTPDASMYYRIFLSMLGITLMAAGLSFYICIHMGLGPLEALTELLCRTLKSSYRVAKITEDVLLVIIGYFFGGTVGIATFLFVCITGIMMQLFQEFYQKRFKKLFTYFESQDNFTLNVKK